MSNVVDPIPMDESGRADELFHHDEAKFSTRVLSVVNLAGKHIRAYLDIPLDYSECLGVVIIASAYGETKENNLILSANFAANGFFGLRFDWTDHLGESDGDIYTSTLSKMQQDLVALLDFVEMEYPGRKIGLVATSLAARVALRIVATDTRLAFLVCVTPIVNLQETLTAVYREDLVGSFRNGNKYGTLNILGFSIDADVFLEDAIDGSFADILSARFDASHVRVPVLFVLGDRDTWVRSDDARSVLEMVESEAKKVILLPTMLHRMLENPTAAKAAIFESIKFVVNAAATHDDHGTVLPVPVDELTLQARIVAEKAHLNDHFVYSKAEERDFWKEYLGNFQYILNVHDYYNLLEFVYTQLGGAWSGQKILDAGCGIGNYGLFLMAKQLYRVQQNLCYLNMPPIRYFGVDFVDVALSEAIVRMEQLRAKVHDKVVTGASSQALFHCDFILGDLDGGLPFADNSFDQVCCNLVLSYVERPAEAMRELWRVLRPGGKMVVSSLKPNADLSEIYRNFTSKADSQNEIEEGRKLLSNAGMIRVKEVRGMYHFYSEKELRLKVREAGFYRARTFRSFGDQANIVVCSKL
jgi:SAM-dependent methyltransferase/alpha-beta hydrolase superfamily lysophospholipase